VGGKEGRDTRWINENYIALKLTIIGGDSSSEALLLVFDKILRIVPNPMLSFSPVDLRDERE